MLSLMMLMIRTGGSWVELPVQGRLCPIFMSRVGLPDIQEYSAGLLVVNGPPENRASQ